MAGVLIVDDDRSVSDPLAHFLAREGHRVEAFSDVAEALARIERADVDVIIADIVMLKFGDVDLLELIRQGDCGSQVVLITGERNLETAAKAVSLGAFDYLEKPVLKKRICSVVAAAARLKKLEDENRRLAAENKAHAEELERLVSERTSELYDYSQRLHHVAEATKNIAAMSDVELLAARFLGLFVANMEVAGGCLLLERADGIVAVHGRKDDFTVSRNFNCDAALRAVASWESSRVVDAGNPVLEGLCRRGMLSAPFAKALVVPLREPQSKLTGAVVVFSEKTSFGQQDRELAEIIAGHVSVAVGNADLRRSLAESEQRYRGVVDASLTGVSIVKGGHVAFANPRLGELLAKSPRKLLGRLMRDYVHPDDKKVFDDNLSALESGIAESARCEVRLIPVGKTPLWAELLLSPAHFDGHPAVLGHFVDITRRKRAEQALMRSEQRYKMLFNSGNDAVFVYPLGRDGTPGPFIEVNEVACRWLGFDKSHLVEFSMLDLAAKDSHRAVLEHHKELVEKEQSLFDLQLSSRDGRTIPVEISARLFELDTSRVLLAVARDISERIKANQERERLEEQFRQAQKMESIGRLAGGVAHDMNNVLGAVMGLASALETDVREPGSKRDIQGILEACIKGRDLTRNLLGFARKGKYLKETVDINEMVAEVGRILERTIPRTVNLTMELDDRLSTVEGDTGQLNHALMNICINAVDAMQEKGNLTITTQNLNVEAHESAFFSGLRPGRYVSVEVSDDGCGMDATTLKLAFEPFFTTKPQGKGTGLGLAMVYGTIKNHGGVVMLASTLGHGTTVTILLPAQQAPARKTSPAPKSDLDASMGEGRTILLVDDEAMIRKSGKRLLQLLGYRVMLAANGEQAVEVYKQHRDDIWLVILDIIMPVMDGPQALLELRQIDPAVRVLLSSGFSRDENTEVLLNLDAVSFISKPYDLQLLAEELTKL